MTAAVAVQLDLFGTDDRTRRLVDGLTCLRDVVPEALEVVVHLADWHPNDKSGVSRCGPWWYTIRRDGLHFEGLNENPRRRTWPNTLTHRVTWREFAEHLADDPRRPPIRRWARSLPEPNWKELIRPYELWPGPWRPDYITGDHERPGWDQRITAWRTVQAILTDAITRLDPTGGAR